MKKEFFDELIKLMEQDQDIFFISCGLGWPRTDELKEKFPERFIQAEASEQAALDIAVGLAYCGKKPFVYTITPFFYRAFETIRTYINYENLPVRLVGVGRNDDYKHDGISHNATDIGTFLFVFRNIKQLWPQTTKDLPHMLKMMVEEDKPWFISIKR